MARDRAGPEFLEGVAAAVVTVFLALVGVRANHLGERYLHLVVIPI